MKQPRLFCGTKAFVLLAIAGVLTILVWVQSPRLIAENIMKELELRPMTNQEATGIRILQQERIATLEKQLEFLQNSISGVVTRIEQLSCTLQKIGSRGGFCLTPEALEVGGNWHWDLPLATELEKLMENKTVGDFGAGLGWYGRYFLRLRESFLPTAQATEKKYFLGVPKVQKAIELPKKIHSWKGYDGAVFIEELTGGLVKFLDLSEPVLLPEKYDWLLSMEVGEHIPQLYEKNYLDNLARHACEGIVLTWAVPKQSGHHHVNNRESSYVKEQLKLRGFKDQPSWETLLKKAATLSWLKNTTMVFVRAEAVSDPLCKPAR